MMPKSGNFMDRYLFSERMIGYTFHYKPRLLVLSFISVFFLLCACGNGEINGRQNTDKPTKEMVAPTKTREKPTPSTKTPQVTATLNSDLSPRSTSTVSVTEATSQPLPTSAIEDSSVSNQLLTGSSITSVSEGPLLAYIQYDSPPTNNVNLLDLGVPTTHEFQVINGTPISVRWLDNQCQLVVTIRTPEGAELVLLDLVNADTRTLFEYLREDPSRESTVFHGNWEVSPNSDHVAYMVYSGDQYYAHSEYQDIAVKSLNNNHRYTLTEHGGALSFSWAPDGNYIAFSDYDSVGVRQLYRSLPDGSDKVKLTSFDEIGSLVGEPIGNYIGRTVWSPDGKKIAFEAGITDADGTFISSLWVVSLTDGQLTRLTEKGVQDYYIMGWNNEGSVLATYIAILKNDEKSDVHLTWIDITSTSTLMASKDGVLPDHGIQLVAAIDGLEQWIGLDDAGNLHLYNARTDQLSRLNDINLPDSAQFLDISGRLSGEAVFPGQIISWAIPPPASQGIDSEVSGFRSILFSAP